jgi:hypothetical protein
MILTLQVWVIRPPICVPIPDTTAVPRSESLLSFLLVIKNEDLKYKELWYSVDTSLKKKMHSSNCSLTFVDFVVVIETVALSCQTDNKT